MVLLTIDVLCKISMVSKFKKKKNYGINEKRIKLSYAFVWVFNVEIGMNMTAILGDIVMRKESIVTHVKYFILCLLSAR